MDGIPTAPSAQKLDQSDEPTLDLADMSDVSDTSSDEGETTPSISTPILSRLGLNVLRSVVPADSQECQVNQVSDLNMKRLSIQQGGIELHHFGWPTSWPSSNGAR